MILHMLYTFHIYVKTFRAQRGLATRYYKFRRGSEMRETKDLNACKKSKNLRVWRIAAIDCCKALKPLETMLLDRVLIEEFLILQYLLLCLDNTLTFVVYYHRLLNAFTLDFSFLVSLGVVRGMQVMYSSTMKRKEKKE